MSAELEIAYAACPAVVDDPAARSPPQRVLVQTPGGPRHAELRLGTCGFVLEADHTDSSGRGAAAAVQEVTMVPSAMVDASEMEQGVLRVSGAWPTFSISLKFSSVADAMDFHEQLQRISQAVMQSLHLRAPPGVPSLTARPLPQVHREPAERGVFRLGGYVIVGEMVNLDDPDLAAMDTTDLANDPPRFCLTWAELCGPDPQGLLSLYFYVNHHADAKFTDFTALTSIDGLAAVGNVLKIAGKKPRGGVQFAYEVPDDMYLSFRTAGEARLWLDVAAQVSRAPRARTASLEAVARLEAVAQEVQRSLEAGAPPSAPLLADASRALRAREREEVPMDPIAVGMREQQEKELLELGDLVKQMQEGPGSFQDGAFAFDSDGTTNFVA
mmetsp:Transcript_64228/g.182388  ORF Transcript_64228/g.182388 Transcript_64228/m.182388 type:complete len:385 (-) Transcript_64228:61-1215(-)